MTVSTTFGPQKFTGGYINPNTNSPEYLEGQSGAAKNISYAWQPSTLSYVAISLDAGGNLLTSGTGGAGAVSIADGSDIAEGSTTDAAVITNAPGTVSAKLRGLVSILSGLRFDQTNSSLVTIDTEHNRVHAGMMFSLSGIITGITSGSTLYFHGLTGAKSIHFRAGSINATNAPITINFYEGSTVSANGTPLSPLNRRRSSATTPTLQTYSNPTVTTTGTLLESGLISAQGPGQSGGIASLFGGEWVLDIPSTHYLIGLTNGSNQSVDVSYNFLWYEA